MTTFKNLIQEGVRERAIFFHKGNINIGDIWDIVEAEEQTFATIEDIPFYDGDTKKEFMLHFVGYAKNKGEWKKFVAYIEKKCKQCEFERFA